MVNKIFCTSLIVFSCATSIGAQAPTMAHKNSEPVSETLRTLERNALLALIGAIVLVALLWLIFIVKECARLHKFSIKNGKCTSLLLALAVGVSALGSSCTAAQRAHAAALQKVQRAENSPCTLLHHHTPPVSEYNNRSPYAGYSNWQAVSFCKYCGKKVFQKSF